MYEEKIMYKYYKTGGVTESGSIPLPSANQNKILGYIKTKSGLSKYKIVKGGRKVSGCLYRRQTGREQSSRHSPLYHPPIFVIIHN